MKGLLLGTSARKRRLLRPTALVAIIMALGFFPKVSESQTNSELIPRLVGYSDRPQFELVPHPAAAAGHKIVVAKMPVADDGLLKNERVSVRFSTKLMADSCNQVRLSGDLEEAVLLPSGFKVLKLSVNRLSMTRTLKNCLNREKIERAVEVMTTLSEPFLLKDNAVIYVPSDVDATVEYWAIKP